MRNLTRRDFVALTGLSLATSLAGCSKGTPAEPFDFAPYRDLEEDHLVVIYPDGSNEEYSVREFGKFILDSKNDEVGLKAKLNDARLVTAGHVMQTDESGTESAPLTSRKAGLHICSGDEGTRSEFFFCYAEDKISNEGIKTGTFVLATSVMRDKTYDLNFNRYVDTDFHGKQRVTLTEDVEIEVVS